MIGTDKRKSSGSGLVLKYIAAVCFVTALYMWNTRSGSEYLTAEAGGRARSAASTERDLSACIRKLRKTTKRLELQNSDDDDDDKDCPVCPKPIKCKSAVASPMAKAAAAHLTSNECDLMDSALSTCREQLRKSQGGATNANAGKIEGQVTMKTPFGKTLYNLAKQDDVKLVLELGTWKGGGSTMVLAKGLKETSGFMITVEALEEHWLQAKRTVANYPVKCLYGTTVDWTLFPTVDEVEADGGIPGYKPSQYESWLVGEKNTAKYHEVPLLEPLCKKHKFDLIFMDGGEFYGIPELEIVLNHCMPKYLALHDTLPYKNRANLKQLMKADSPYEVIENNTDETGHALLRRKD